MEIEEIRLRITSGVGASELHMSGEACNLSVIVVSEAFAGLSPVKRQQLVMSTVKEPLATGELHALSMQVFTPAEWEVRKTCNQATAKRPLSGISIEVK